MVAFLVLFAAAKLFKAAVKMINLDFGSPKNN